MKMQVVTAVACGMLLAVNGFASASWCGKEGTAKCEKKEVCKDNAVKHCKTMTGQGACPVAIWAAEAIGPNGEVLDEAVAIWQTSDGNTWVAKKVKHTDEVTKGAMVAADGKKYQVMDKMEAKKECKKPAMDAVKAVQPCPKKGTKDCPAMEHAKSVDGKTVACGKTDMKKDAPKTDKVAASDAVVDDGYFIVVEED